MFGGLEEVLKFIKYFKFTEDDIEYLKEQMPNAKEEFFSYLKNLDCS